MMMRRKHMWLAGAALMVAGTALVAQEAPESLLPPGFDDPAPAPAPAAAPAPAPSPTPAPSGGTPAPSGSAPVVQPIPGASPAPVASGPLPSGLPSIAELEELDPEELDELLGLKPRFDIPPAARRSMERVGVLSDQEGGLPTAGLAKQPAGLVRASLLAMDGQIVSRWGHILVRRALASRLAAPEGMNPAEFAGLRAKALNAMGEHAAARALVQDVDTGNWNKVLLDAAFDAYIGTADILGACPAVQVKPDLRDDPQWDLLKNICFSYAGQGSRSRANLNRAYRNETAPAIDIQLAQRFAGAAARGGQAVNLEWDGVEELNPWRFALANAVGAEIPEGLMGNLSPYYLNVAATAPTLSHDQRAAGAEEAARRGVLSASAMVDIYSQVQARGMADGPAALTASRLREAYVAADVAARMAAIRDVWGSETPDYARYVLTAYAAARITPNAEMEEDAAPLIASMLTAGLDADALTWGAVVPQGSEAWALLALVQPTRANPVTEGQVSSFIGDDESKGQRKSQFLLAGLAGLGRIENAARDELAADIGLDLGRASKWSQLIGQAAEVNNPALVALLAGVGMQAREWDAMTPRHLYHIVAALNRVGLDAEARMIAAEAVARS